MATGFALIGRELDADREAGSNVGALAKKSGVASRLEFEPEHLIALDFGYDFADYRFVFCVQARLSLPCLRAVLFALDARPRSLISTTPFLLSHFSPGDKIENSRRNFSRSAGLSASSLRFIAPAMI